MSHDYWTQLGTSDGVSRDLDCGHRHTTAEKAIECRMEEVAGITPVGLVARYRYDQGAHTLVETTEINGETR
jgi:hypothetical protein